MNTTDIIVLRAFIARYLNTLPEDDGGEIYGSYRAIAKDELAQFLEWLKHELPEDRIKIEVEVST